MGRRVALLSAAAMTMVPAAATAQGGDPPPTSGPCATLVSNDAGRALNVGKPIEQSWTVGNCSAAGQTVTVRVVPAAFRISNDGVNDSVTECTPKPFTAGSLTLKPGEKRSLRITVPSDPCYAPFQGRIGINFNASGSVAGTVLATAFSSVTIRNRA